MKGKILVVEDEKLIREQIRTKLEFDGCEVWEADSALALKTAMAGPQPDVVVLDVMLDPSKENDRAGLDSLPQIKKRWPETEVIVLTGRGSVEMAVEAPITFCPSPSSPKSCWPTSTTLWSDTCRRRRPACSAGRWKP